MTDREDLIREARKAIVDGPIRPQLFDLVARLIDALESSSSLTPPVSLDGGSPPNAPSSNAKAVEDARQSGHRDSGDAGSTPAGATEMRAALERIAALIPWTLEPRGMLYTAVRIAEEALAASPPSVGGSVRTGMTNHSESVD